MSKKNLANEAELLYEQDKLTLIKKVIELQYIVDNTKDSVIMPTVEAALKAMKDKIEYDLIHCYRPSDIMHGFEVTRIIQNYFHPQTIEEKNAEYWFRVGMSP